MGNALSRKSEEAIGGDEIKDDARREKNEVAASRPGTISVAEEAPRGQMYLAFRRGAEALVPKIKTGAIPPRAEPINSKSKKYDERYTSHKRRPARRQQQRN